jgi:hypothetical protein
MWVISAVDLVAGSAGVTSGQGVTQHGQLRGCRGHGLVEAAGLGGVQGRRVGEHDAPIGAEDAAAVLQRGHAGEPVGVHDVSVGSRAGQQVRAVRRWDRPDEPQPGRGQVREVGR